jgi:hypothetical protein
MTLTDEGAVDLATEAYAIWEADQPALAVQIAYRKGSQPHPALDTNIPREVRKFIDMSRVNMVDLVVDVISQSLYVDGYRSNVLDEDATDEAEAWAAWQANKMDARQAALHRGALTYGVSYNLILPGTPYPVIKGYSPRKMVAVYGGDQDWALFAMIVEGSGDTQYLTLYDAEAQYSLTKNKTQGADSKIEFVDKVEHSLGVCPVIRFNNIDDLDDDVVSEIDRLIPIQDQIDVATFGLVVAQHYSAFLQRYIIGWDADNEGDVLKAGASRLWTFDDPDVTVGQFQQTQLEGYLKSREDSAQFLAVVSQTPPHHLLGELVNLSAEALAAAESGHRRKIAQRQTTFGESHEQSLSLVSVAMGNDPDDNAEVRWRDTEARSLSQTVDALGKMAQMLGIPPAALWEKIPGATQQDIAHWTRLLKEGDSVSELIRLIETDAQL